MKHEAPYWLADTEPETPQSEAYPAPWIDTAVVGSRLPRVDAYEVGGIVALFERAVGLYASLIGINAYHQPGVEAGKQAARDVLDLAGRIDAALTDRGARADALAERLDADPVQVFHLLGRLVATGRARREGSGVDATFSAPEGK